MNTTGTRRSLTLTERAEIRSDAIFEVFGSFAVEQHGTRELLQADILERMMREAETETGLSADDFG